MLRFNKIEMENFGPYQGKKTVDFTNKDGVIIVWGNNGLGKTTLLNAFKYVLFEKVVGRGSEMMAKKEIINWESFKNGIYSFKVILHFSLDGVDYILTREFKLSQPGLDPNNEKNYRDTVMLWKNGAILSPSETQHTINKIMPEQVSRFFLFDGELLKEYEELLSTEKGIGQKIKNAIEEILGVPILSNALADINRVQTEYEKKLSDAAVKDSEQKARGEALDRANQQLQVLRDGLDRLKAEETEYVEQLEALEVEQSKNERIKLLVDEITLLKKNITEWQAKIVTLKEKITESTSLAWEMVLSDLISSYVQSMSGRVAELDDKQHRHQTAMHVLEELQSSYESGTCIICDTELTSDHLAKIGERIATYSTQYAELTPAEKDERNALCAQIALLKKATTTDKTEIIQHYEDEIFDCLVDIADAEQKIKELSKDIEDYSKQKTEIEQITNDIKKYTSLLATVRQGIDETKAKIEEQEDLIKKAKTALLQGGSSSADYVVAQRKAKFCSELRDLFDDSLDTYRQYLKQQVEEDATKIFLNLSSDDSYVALRINDNFGLNIEHESGKIVSVRSAGFEHLVALSLIGALHKNAPLQGPIVMDSPFGRLDSIHEKNIINYLPELANQVMLFVFDKEINEQLTRERLGEHLIEEFKLSRGNTFETVIERL